MNATTADPRVRPVYLVHRRPKKGGESYYEESTESDYTLEGVIARVIGDPSDVDHVVMFDLADGICGDVTEDIANDIKNRVEQMGFCSLDLGNFLMKWCNIDYRERERLRGASASALDYLDRATVADHRRGYLD